MPPNELAGLRGALNQRAGGRTSQTDTIRILALMTPEQRQAYVRLVGAPPMGTGNTQPPAPAGGGSDLLGLLRGLLARREPAPALAPEPELETPWMEGFESLPAPAPVAPALPAPPPVQPGDEVALLAEHLRKRREKMLPLQYLANPPPEPVR